MRAPDRGDASGMTRNGQPVVHRGPDPAPLQWRIALALMAGNQQQNPVTRGYGAFQRVIDRGPGAIEAVTMEIEDPVGFDPTRG